MCGGIEVEEGDLDPLSRFAVDDPRSVVTRGTSRLVSGDTGDTTCRKSRIERLGTTTAVLTDRQHCSHPQHTTDRLRVFLLVFFAARCYAYKQHNHCSESHLQIAFV